MALTCSLSGKGFDNYDPVNNPAKFNLVDLVERNTIGIPTSGWVVIRFLADDLGLYRLECLLSSSKVLGIGGEGTDKKFL